MMLIIYRNIGLNSSWTIFGDAINYNTMPNSLDENNLFICGTEFTVSHPEHDTVTYQIPPGKLALTTTQRGSFSQIEIVHPTNLFLLSISIETDHFLYFFT